MDVTWRREEMEHYYEAAIAHFANAVERFTIPGRREPYAEDLVNGLHRLAQAMKQESETTAKRLSEIERRLPTLS